MATPWKTVRVFVSSTFRDMHAERDHLVKVVFPRLRETFEKDHIHLVDIDLRWGVTAEQAEDDLVLDLCLKQIDTCRPFFIGILGERYGWVPKNFPIDACRNFGWIQYHTGKSLTELEILYGAMNDSKMHERAMFFLRDPSFIANLQIEKRNIFLEGPTENEIQELTPEKSEACAEDRRQKLNHLKHRILELREKLFVYENYPCRWDSDTLDPAEKTPGRLVGLEEFGQQVFNQLENAIRIAPELQEHFQAITNPPSDPYGLLEERDYHDRFTESRLQVYVGRDDIHQKLIGYLESGLEKPLLLTGGSGTGKSAILAKLARDFVQKHPDVFVLTHFIGASLGSTNMHKMLRRFCLELRERFGLTQTVKIQANSQGQEREEIRPFEVPEDPIKLLPAYREILNLVPIDEQIVLIIDAVNQLDDTSNAHEMYWLPSTLPANIRIVVSCIEEKGREQEALEALRARKIPEITVASLTKTEQFEIVTQIPSLSAKTLSPGQIRLLLNNPATMNPLYLIVALEELRGYGRFGKRGELLEEKIASFSQLEGEAGLDALFIQVIERLEAEIGMDVVQPILGSIACSRMGLSEKELSEILVRLKKTTQGTWLLRPLDSIKSNKAEQNRQEKLIGDMQVMLRQLRPYLMRRGELVDFYHRNLYKAVHVRYLDAEEKTQAVHARLADYFNSQDWFLESLEDQRARTKRFPPTSRPVNNRKVDELPWQQLRTKRRDAIERLFTDLLFLEAKTEAGKVFELAGDFASAVKALPKDCSHRLIPKLLDVALRRDIHFISRHPTTLFQCLWNYSWWYDRPESTMHYLEPEGCRIVDNALWRQPDGDKLYLLLESWRDLRKRTSRFFPWIRSLRPPPIPLGSAQKAIFCGHKDHVTSVSFSPDGRCVASGSRDKTVRVWDVKSGAQLLALTGHDDVVKSLSFSPDNRRVVSGSHDKTVRVWDAQNGTELNVMRGHRNWVSSVAFSPDGNRIVSGSHDKTVRVWDAQSGDEQCVFQGHGDYVTSVAFSPDGRQIISGSQDSTVRLWDPQSGAELAILSGHKNRVHTVSISPDGKEIIIGSDEEYITVLEAETGFVWSVKRGHKGRINSVAFSPDGRRIVSGSDDKTVRVWGDKKFELSGHKDYVTSVAFSPDGRQVVSGSRDKTVRIWDAQSGISQNILLGHGDYVTSVAFSPDGRQVVSSSRDKTVRVWDAQSGVLQYVLLGHEDYVTSVAFSPDGRRIVSGSDDKTARVWDAHRRTQLTVLNGHDRTITSVAFSPDGQRIVSGSRDKSVRVWDAHGIELNVLRGHEGNVVSVTFSPDGRRIVSGADDRTVRVWDARSGDKLVHYTASKYDTYITSVAFSPEGKRIASSSQDYKIRVWDVQSEDELAVLSGHTGYVVRSVAFSPDGGRILSGSDDDTVQIWDAKSGEQLAIYRGHEGDVTGVAFSPDGRHIVSGSEDGTVRVWDAQNAKDLPISPEHEDYITSVVFSSDGRRIASSSRDKTVRVWDAQNGIGLNVLRGHEGNVTSVAFSPDGRLIVSSSDDKTVRVWDTQSGAELNVLRGHESYVKNASFILDGRVVISSGYYEKVRVWDVQSGVQLAVLNKNKYDLKGISFSSESMNISPDGRRIVLVSDDYTVLVWDAKKGFEPIFLRGHKGYVTQVVFSPDGQRVASSSRDKTVRLWDAKSGVQLAVLTGHDGVVTSLSFSPDNRRIVSGSRDKTVRIWDIQSGIELVVLSGHDQAVTRVTFSRDGQRIIGKSRDRRVRVWDAETWQCLQVFQSTSDVAAIASGLLWGAFTKDGHTTFERIIGGIPVCQYPIALENIKIHMNGPTLTGSIRNHLYILALEDYLEIAELK